MKAIIISITISVLIFTFGCNYDYGKYGKNKTESAPDQTNVEGAVPSEEAGSKN